jgi:hypothetical protein
VMPRTVELLPVMPRTVELLPVMPRTVELLPVMPRTVELLPVMPAKTGLAKQKTTDTETVAAMNPMARSGRPVDPRCARYNFGTSQNSPWSVDFSYSFGRLARRQKSLIFN